MSISTSFGASCGGEINCSCGDTVTSNYILNKDLQCNTSYALNIKASIDCNGHTISDKQQQKNIGILLQAYDSKIIKNCNIENFKTGLSIQTRREQQSWTVYRTYYTYNTQIYNNTFENNEKGIQTTGVKENIYNNKLINNKLYGIDVNSNTNTIWNNSFYKTGINLMKTNNNLFSKNDVGNYYFGGAIGPKKDCLPIYDGMTINSNVLFCKDTYNLTKEILLMEKSTIDCNNAILMGNNSGTGIKIDGYDSSTIKNCQISNFSIGIYSSLRKENQGYEIYRYYYNKYTNISNNIFKNNQIGINANQGIYENIWNNIFANNTEIAIFLDSKTGNVWNNSFHKTGIIYTKSNSNTFCKNNISNIYYDNLTGPECNCIIPLDNMLINSDTNLCENRYNLPNGLKVDANSKLNCNNATLIGNNTKTGLLIQGVTNTKIHNCNILNYSTGIYYTNKKVKSGTIYRTYSSRNNILLNSTIFNVDTAIKISDPSRIENLHNNNLMGNVYNIDNKYIGNINATKNWWGTSNETQIENKFNSAELISYKPYLDYNLNLDLWISNKDISLLNFENQTKIYLKLHGIYPKPISNLQIEFLDVYNYKIQKKKLISIKNSFKDEILVTDIWNLEKGHELHVILDPMNNLNDPNKENNYAKKLFDDSYQFFIDINVSSFILKSQIKDYLINNLGEKYIVENKENADIQISISEKSKNNPDSNLNTININNNFKLPYEAEINSKNIIVNNSNNFKIEIVGFGTSGVIAGIKELILNKNNYIDINNKYSITSKNKEAISIYDYLNSMENKLYLNTNTTRFKTILNKIFYDEKYIYEEISIPFNSENRTINYKLKKLSPKNSLNYQNYVDRDNFPIVMAGGLWSDIDTWKNLAEELANKGYEVYLIELTGGKESELEVNYNYDYKYLTDIVYPTYINKILELSNSDKIKFIGHSNGARTAIDSLTREKINKNIIDTLILVGVPGAFEELSLFGKILNKYGVNAIGKIDKEELNHIGISDLTKKLTNRALLKFNGDDNLLELTGILMSFSKKNKISTNLFKQYFKWINTTDDKQPGENLDINHLTIIYGDATIFNKNDGIVSVIDEIKIFNNINSKDKISFKTKALHTGMADDIEIKNLIKERLENEDFS